MSEKRFVLFGLDNETIKDDVTKECYWVNEYVQRKKLVDLLNDLNDENEQLKHYKLYEDNKRLQTIIADLKEENEKLGNIHLSIDLTYSYGYGRYLADVRVVDDEWE